MTNKINPVLYVGPPMHESSKFVPLLIFGYIITSAMVKYIQRER